MHGSRYWYLPGIGCGPVWSAPPAGDAPTGPSAMLPEVTPPPLTSAVPVDLPGSLTVGPSGFIGRHPFLFALILLLSTGLTALASILIGRRIRRTVEQPVCRPEHPPPVRADSRYAYARQGYSPTPPSPTWIRPMAVTDGTLRYYTSRTSWPSTTMRSTVG